MNQVLRLLWNPQVIINKCGSAVTEYIFIDSWIFFLPWHTACRILVPWPGVEPSPLAVKVQSPNHWTTRELPWHLLLSVCVSIMVTWCEELTPWKRPWCCKRLKAGGEGDDRGWDGRMASPTPWTWVWASSGRWWSTEELGVVQTREAQRVSMT